MADGLLDEDIILSAIFILLFDDKKKTKKEEKKTSTWVRPWLARREEGGFYHQLLSEISLEDTAAFHELLRVTKTQFHVLVDTLSPRYIYCEYIYDKATKRLYGLRILKKSGLSPSDLVAVYCSTIRSVLEYASPVWAALPAYLNDLLELVQRIALYIVFPDRSHSDALHLRR